MSSRRVVVTGLGCVSAYGLGVDVFWDSTLRGESAVRSITDFDPAPYRSALGAPVPDELKKDRSLWTACGNPKEEATFLAALAAREALGDAGFGAPVEAGLSDGFGCVVGTLCSSARYYESLAHAYTDGLGFEAAAVDTWPDIDHSLIQYQLDFLCEALGLHGPSSLISTACSSGTDAVGAGFDLLRDGQCERVLVVGGDIISEVIHAGFNSVFSVTQDTPRPFDRNRDGFIIGEGGAALVLEPLDVALARGAKVYAEVLGYGLSNSAYHLTAPSQDGSGEALAVARALADAQLAPDRIDFVNTHGTATTHNDHSEVLALGAVFGDRAPDISITSVKSMIGHCMGAAGLMEAVSTVKTMDTGLIPPTINFREPEEINRFGVVANAAIERRVRYAISNSFGFAGHNSCVVFGSVAEAAGLEDKQCAAS